MTLAPEVQFYEDVHLFVWRPRELRYFVTTGSALASRVYTSR